MDRACRISNVSATQRSEFIRGTVPVTQLLTGAFVCLGIQRVISSTSSKWATSRSSNIDRASLLRNRPGREIIHQEHLTRQGRGHVLGFASRKVGKRREVESALGRKEEVILVAWNRVMRIQCPDRVGVSILTPGRAISIMARSTSRPVGRDFSVPTDSKTERSGIETERLAKKNAESGGD
jgi:hypothetical protein